MKGVTPQFEPAIIEEYAKRLYGKARSVVIGSSVAGGLLGAGFGAVPLTSLGAAWPVPSSFGFATLVIGGITGALIGYVVADARAFGYLLQAQSALCQLQIERNTAAAAEAVPAAIAPARTAPASRPASRPAPPPAPASVRLPAPSNGYAAPPIEIRG